MSNALYHWVTESTRTVVINKKTIDQHIQEILDKEPSPKEEISVYRVQQEDSNRIIPRTWFSTSDELEKVIRQHVSRGATCCLFKIHVLPGIKRLVVDEYLAKFPTSKHKKTEYDESEIIVDGKGQFYADAKLQRPGFQEIDSTKGITTFETWYGPPKRIVGANELFERVSPEEYPYLNSVDNLKQVALLNANEVVRNNTFQNVLNRIRRGRGGSRRQTRKKNLRKKRKSTL